MSIDLEIKIKRYRLISGNYVFKSSFMEMRMEVLTFRVFCCISEALGWLNEALSETKNKLKFLSHVHTHEFCP